jgi:hypothetical protein
MINVFHNFSTAEPDRGQRLRRSCLPCHSLQMSVMSTQIQLISTSQKLRSVQNASPHYTTLKTSTLTESLQTFLFKEFSLKFHYSVPWYMIKCDVIFLTKMKFFGVKYIDLGKEFFLLFINILHIRLYSFLIPHALQLKTSDYRKMRIAGLDSISR